MIKGSTKLISIKIKNYLRYTYMSIKYQFLRKNLKGSLKQFIGYNENDDIIPYL